MKQIDKIRAEIERRYAEYLAKMENDNFTYYEGMADALDLLEQFIDSLQQEQPEVDLEKEIERFYGMYRDVDGEYRDLEDNMIVCPWYEGENQLWIKDFARHFYELGLNAKEDKK